MTLRVGNGFDVHRFADASDGATGEGESPRPLVLGGVTFEGVAGLIGHSDADVVAHAVAEALLGAAGMDDLGSHFPDSDDRWRDADSLMLLGEVVSKLADSGWRVLNVDCSVVAEKPKLAPRRSEMQERLSAVVHAPVTLKGRRAEGLGALGRVEGIACLASALLESVDVGTPR